jgi:hypothetical protein
MSAANAIIIVTSDATVELAGQHPTRWPRPVTWRADFPRMASKRPSRRLVFSPVRQRHWQPERCDLYAVAEGAEAPKFDRGRCALCAQTPLRICPAASAGEGHPRLPDAPS